MAAGKPKHSPIIDALAFTQEGTSGEIRVHLSQRLLDGDPFAQAEKLFRKYNMFRTTDRNAILFYVNLRRKKFAIIGDVGIHQAVGQEYWNGLAAALAEDLKKMPAEKAIALAVCTAGATLQKYFPKEPLLRN